MQPMRFITAFTSTRHLFLSWANSLTAAVSEPALHRLLTFQVPNRMSLFRCLGCTKVSVQVRGPCHRFVTVYVFYGDELLTSRPTPSWRTTPCRLSATAYSIYSQLPSILETVPPIATWGRAMPWWQGPTYCGSVVCYWTISWASHNQKMFPMSALRWGFFCSGGLFEII